METISIIKTWKEYIYTYRRINLKSVCKSVFKSSTSHYSWATLGATSGDRIENKSIYRNETWRWSTRISEKIHRWNPRTKEMRIPLRGGSAHPPRARCSIRIIIQSPQDRFDPQAIACFESKWYSISEWDRFWKNHSISLLLPVSIDSDAEKNYGHGFRLLFSPRLINGAKVSTLFRYRISRLVVELLSRYY